MSGIDQIIPVVGRVSRKIVHAEIARRAFACFDFSTCVCTARLPKRSQRCRLRAYDRLTARRARVGAGGLASAASGKMML